MSIMERRVSDVLRPHEKGLSVPVIAVLLDMDEGEVGSVLDQLFRNSRVEVRHGDEPVYRLVESADERRKAQLPIRFSVSAGTTPLCGGRGHGGPIRRPRLPGL